MDLGELVTSLLWYGSIARGPPFTPRNRIMPYLRFGKCLSGTWNGAENSLPESFRTSYPSTWFLCSVLRLVQLSLLTPPVHVCSVNFRLEMATQRLPSITGMPPTLPTTRSGCPVRQGELSQLLEVCHSLLQSLMDSLTHA